VDLAVVVGAALTVAPVLEIAKSLVRSRILARADREDGFATKAP
jgi:hypothetical protein